MPGRPGRSARRPSTERLNAADIGPRHAAGCQVLGGGYSVAKGPEIVAVPTSEPVVTGGIYTADGWHVTASLTNANSGSGNFSVAVWVICAYAS